MEDPCHGQNMNFTFFEDSNEKNETDKTFPFSPTFHISSLNRVANQYGGYETNLYFYVKLIIKLAC